MQTFELYNVSFNNATQPTWTLTNFKTIVAQASGPITIPTIALLTFKHVWGKLDFSKTKLHVQNWNCNQRDFEFQMVMFKNDTELTPIIRLTNDQVNKLFLPEWRVDLKNVQKQEEVKDAKSSS